MVVLSSSSQSHNYALGCLYDRPGCVLDCLPVAFWLRPRRARPIALRIASWPCVPNRTSPA
eukprot:4921155-Alexandrium_andersonii.AAC.1